MSSIQEMDMYGFNLGKRYSSVADMSDNRARRYLNQVNISLIQKSLAANLYVPGYKLTKFGVHSLTDEADLLAAEEIMKTADDDEGDLFIAKIIRQRHEINRRNLESLSDEAMKEANIEREAAAKIHTEYELAVERSAVVDAQREKERVMKIYRFTKARKIVQEIVRKRNYRLKQEKQVDDALAVWEADEKKKKKTASNDLNI